MSENDNQAPVQIEPAHCAEARIIDAASWIVKAAAQLSVLNDEKAATIALGLQYTAATLLSDFQQMAKAGAMVAEPAHELMIRHALLNAAGHAWYAQDPAAKELLERGRATKSEKSA